MVVSIHRVSLVTP